MIEARVMWRDETGRGWDTWKEAAHADATRYIYQLLNAVMPDADMAMRAADELARGIYVNGEIQLLEPWGKMYGLAETQPGYTADGEEIKPAIYQEMHTLPAAIRKMNDDKVVGIWRVFRGGKK